MCPSKPRRLAILGDSILGNGSYTSPAPDTTAHVRRLLGAGCTVECGGRDGATMRADPALAVLARIALAVLNDRIQRAAARHRAEVLEFRQVAAQLAALPPGRPAVVVLSVGGSDILERSQVVPSTTAPVALALSAIPDLSEDLGARHAGVLEVLRPATDRLIPCTICDVPLDACTRAEDFALEIEPSAEGARKIATAIVSAVTE